jgi:hypothetical protein
MPRRARALNPWGEIPDFHGLPIRKKKLNAIKTIFELWRSLAEGTGASTNPYKTSENQLCC